MKKPFLAAAAAVGLLGAHPAIGQVTLFTENFDSLAPTLQPIVTFDSEQRNGAAWTDVPPADWVVDDSGVPTVGNANTGVVEFEGWSFVDRDWWIGTAGDQDRSEFISGFGVVAVADPDEWDDFGTPDPSDVGFFDAKLTTPSIDLTAAPIGEDIKVFFNSSWRPEVDQKATLTATFNDGASTQRELLRYESRSLLPDDVTANPFFKDDATNEGVVIPLVDNTGSGGLDFSVPAGATEMTLEFRLFDAGNNWWWAFDNLQVFTGDNPPSGGALRTIINRDTGNVQIVNETGDPVQLRGYSITSGAGVFQEESANFLAPADNWLTATNVGDEPNDLSELNLVFATLPTADTGNPSSTAHVIDLGDVWTKYFVDAGDVAFEYLVAGNDTPVPGIVEFIGNNDASFDPIDLNHDGTVDIDDWVKFLEGYGKDLVTGVQIEPGVFRPYTSAELYNLSDLNTDGAHTAADFLQFQAAFLAVAGPGSFPPPPPAVPEPAAAGLLALAGLGVVAVRRRGASLLVGLIAFVAIGATSQDASAQLSLYFEDFESATLGPFQEEDVAGQEVWTNTLPGWTTDNTGVPGVGILDIPGVDAPDDDPLTDSDSNGVSDWAGWAWVDKAAWIEADDQGRSQFTRGTGVVMVADPDEWDDQDGGLRNPLAQAETPDNLYDVFATTPSIPIPSGIPAGRITLSFDSSWLGDEFQDDLDGDNNQTALINARFDGGSPVEVFRRESDPEDDTYDPFQQNERVSQIDLQYDGVATSLQLEFAMVDAWNDWWWAIDNIDVGVQANPLKLIINTTTGEGTLEGDDTIDTAINFFSIESANGVLRGDLATGLAGSSLAGADGPDAGTDVGDNFGEQWESLTDSETSDTQIAEAFLFGESVFNDTVSVSLGTIFDTSTLEADRDVVYSYALASGDVVQLGADAVEYISGGVPGDFDGDGDVDDDDFGVFAGAFGGSGPIGDFDMDGDVDDDDFGVFAGNFGTGVPSSAIPEPTSVALVGLGVLALAGARSRAARVAPLLLVVGVALVGTQAGAVTLDRDYKLGDDTRENAAVNGIVGALSPQGGGFTIDSDGATGQNQIISMEVEGTTQVIGGGTITLGKPRYISVSDRPDIAQGLVTIRDETGAAVATPLGVALNPFPQGSSFNDQYLATGFGEALNYPERSPSSTFAVPAGTINYDLISDRGFQLWTKPTPRDVNNNPTPVTTLGEQHIVMDSNQHGVLINADGEFAMRYAFDQDVIDQLAVDNGVPASEFADFFDAPSGVVAQTDTWYHVSVVRPFGPSNGSILYVNGEAVAAAVGEYNVEEVPVDDFGQPDLSNLDTSPLVVGAATGNPTFGDEFYYSGVVDDLEMFVIGINADNFFPEFDFENDNGYASVFKPTTPGDVDGDDDVDLDDAAEFAANWLFERRVPVNNAPAGNAGFLVVGDLVSRGKGDLNYDGVVDLADWAILNNQNPGVASGAAKLIAGLPVPEPGAAMLASLAMVCGGFRSRRSR